MINSISSVFQGSKVPINIDDNFANLVGMQLQFNSSLTTRIAISFITDTFDKSYVYKAIMEAKTIQRLAKVIQFFCLASQKHREEQVNSLYQTIKEAVNISPGISIEITLHNNSIIIYPAGSKLLDEKVVNDVLGGLENYPEAAKPFQHALTSYMSGEASRGRNLLDDLRLSLEQLLKSILKNDKFLENQKSELLSWINQKGIHQQIINLYQELIFKHFSKYQNEAVKHNDQYSEKEIEFMIYLTGTFMRLLIQLDRGT